MSKKRESGVWVSDSPHIYNTSTDIITHLPAELIPDGQLINGIIIKGNMSQSGTPSPSSPVYPQETGDKTANLYDYTSYFDSVFTVYNEYFEYADLYLQPNTQYTLSTSYGEYLGDGIRITAFIVATPDELPTTANGGISTISPITITTKNDGILRLYKRIAGANADYIPTEIQFDNGAWLMLNTGSTALPHGYKIPVLSGGVTTNFYLGQVQTARRIKKLVLTGEENWIKSESRTGSMYTQLVNAVIPGFGFCDRAVNARSIDEFSSSGRIFIEMTTAWSFLNVWLFDTAISVVDFKSYLAAQYAAGTPVVVWCVLSTETTGIINEPIRRIGDYADSVSVSNIPTTAGSQQFDVTTTLKPSEVDLTYHGWHPKSDKESSGGEWS